MDKNMDEILSKIQNKFTPEYFEELSKKHYKEDREYPENFSNWYPHIIDFGKFKTANIINNQIFTWEETETMEETDQINKVNWNKLNEILKPTLDKMKPNTQYNIKNGCFSNKFKFSTCITDKEHLAENLWKINYASSMYDTGGYTELVVRELIPYNYQKTPTIYNGMPLRNELRIFYNIDKKKIEYSINYWDFNYCYNNIYNLTDKIIFKWFHSQKDIKNNYLYLLQYVHQYIDTLKFDEYLTGIWSMDFMLCNDSEDYDGIYLIDMARGFRSAYWDPDKINWKK